MEASLETGSGFILCYEHPHCAPLPTPGQTDPRSPHVPLPLPHPSLPLQAHVTATS